jgi:hypothetical protein
MNEKRPISTANKWLWGTFSIGLLLVAGMIFYYVIALGGMVNLDDEVNICEAIAITSIAVFVYLIPTIIFGRKKRSVAAIAVLNLYLGWTVIGWIVALVWASTKDRDSIQIRTLPKAGGD